MALEGEKHIDGIAGLIHAQDTTQLIGTYHGFPEEESNDLITLLDEGTMYGNSRTTILKATQDILTDEGLGNRQKYLAIKTLILSHKKLSEVSANIEILLGRFSGKKPTGLSYISKRLFQLTYIGDIDLNELSDIIGSVWAFSELNILIKDFENASGVLNAQGVDIADISKFIHQAKGSVTLDEDQVKAARVELAQRMRLLDRGSSPDVLDITRLPLGVLLYVLLSNRNFPSPVGINKAAVLKKHGFHIKQSHVSQIQGMFVSDMSLVKILKALSLKKHSEGKNMYKLLREVIPPHSRNSLDFIKQAVSLQLITKGEALKIMEGSNGFQKGGVTVFDFFNEVGFPRRLEDGIIVTIEQNLGRKVKAGERSIFLERMKRLVCVFLQIESHGGWNVINQSTKNATGYFQFLPKDGKKSRRRTAAGKIKHGWRGSSLDTGMGRLLQYREVLELFPDFQRLIDLKERYVDSKIPKQSVNEAEYEAKSQQAILSLKAGYQTILSLCNLLGNNKDIRRGRLRRYSQIAPSEMMHKILLADSPEEAEKWIMRVYAHVHHTDIDGPTILKMADKFGVTKEKISTATEVAFVEFRPGFLYLAKHKNTSQKHTIIVKSGDTLGRIVASIGDNILPGVSIPVLRNTHITPGDGIVGKKDRNGDVTFYRVKRGRRLGTFVEKKVFTYGPRRTFPVDGGYGYTVRAGDTVGRILKFMQGDLGINVTSAMINKIKAPGIHPGQKIIATKTGGKIEFSYRGKIFFTFSGVQRRVQPEPQQRRTVAETGYAITIKPGSSSGTVILDLIRKFRASKGMSKTRITKTKIMNELRGIGKFPFHGGAKLSIRMPKKEGVAYIISHDGKDILQVRPNGKFNRI